MSQKLTILHLVSLMGMGGRCATALRQVRLLSARGHRVMVGCLSGSTAGERARAIGLQVYDDFNFRRGLRPLAVWRDCRLLAQRCDAEKVDVLHAHLSQESWIAAIGARLCKRRPVVIRSRGVVVPVKSHYFNRLLHNKLTDHVIAPSSVIAENLRALPGFDQQRISLTPDGVDIARFNPCVDGFAIRAEFGIPAAAPLVAMVARLEKVKGHTVFFDALARMRLSSSVPGLRAICACDERSPGALQAAIDAAKSRGLDASIISFTGLRGDVEKIIAAANVIVLPSLGSEGSSRVALESAASGRAIVASNVGCLPEVIQDQKTGLIVPHGDPSALAAALETLLNNPMRTGEMGSAARNRAEELYDEQMMAQRIEAIYMREIAAHKP